MDVDIRAPTAPSCISSSRQSSVLSHRLVPALCRVTLAEEEVKLDENPPNLEKLQSKRTEMNCSGEEYEWNSWLLWLLPGRKVFDHVWIWLHEHGARRTLPKCQPAVKRLHLKFTLLAGRTTGCSRKTVSYAKVCSGGFTEGYVRERRRWWPFSNGMSLEGWGEMDSVEPATCGNVSSSRLWWNSLKFVLRFFSLL